MKKEKLILEEAEEALKKQGPKMNAMSRRIMERKMQQRGESEGNPPLTSAGD